MTVETRTVNGAEDRPLGPFTDRKVDRASRPGSKRNRHDLATLAQDREGAMTPLETELFDVRTDRFGHA